VSQLGNCPGPVLSQIRMKICVVQPSPPRTPAFCREFPEMASCCSHSWQFRHGWRAPTGILRLSPLRKSHSRGFRPDGSPDNSFKKSRESQKWGSGAGRPRFRAATGESRGRDPAGYLCPSGQELMGLPPPVRGKRPEVSPAGSLIRMGMPFVATMERIAWGGRAVDSGQWPVAGGQWD
jgi:hypothetical protein